MSCLAINTDTTKEMAFSKQDVCLTIDLEHVNQYKYLGVTFISNANSDAKKTLCMKTSRAFLPLNRIYLIKPLSHL